MTQTVSTAVAVQESGPGALVAQCRPDFELVMPSHLQKRVGAWIRTTQGLLRRNEKLLQAAQNDVGQFMSVLLDAARLGLEPGTEQYYLVPRWNKKKGCTEVTGVRGYQGEIELMYRAGAVSSVIVEVVYDQDRFEYRPGRDERPLHEIDWDAEHRGELRLAYAYAVMKDGATSKVVVLNKGHIAKAKAKSDSASGKYPHLSPWATDTEAMWLKTAAHQLTKWVPTSAEYIREQLRAHADVTAEQQPAPAALAQLPQPIDTTDDEAIEAEFVDEEA
ncbi:recombinase RecT [Streptomyces californicus]|uniref:recombinase RecT n=1 Tax=Streptomyces californicus TaxID=67351 RepID=UPI0004BE8B46|nr:recombinase RecT [Streptomyces californicus]QRV56650.1 recombinase RecT [Streptomyces californicus]